jgi:hypothetical protein
MAGKVTITAMGNNKQSSPISYHIPVLNASNIVTNLDETVGGTLGDVLLALADVCLMDLVKYDIHASIVDNGVTYPADVNARRDRAMVLSYVDNTFPNMKGIITIPGVDLTVVASPNTDEVDLTITEVAALVTALETAARSKIGNSITITSGRLVGRNN